MDLINEATRIGIALAVTYVPKVLLALLTLIIGLWLIKISSNLAESKLRKSKIDDTIHQFLISIIVVILKILLFITVISMFGVQMTSFIALLGAAGLAVGLALQGSLSNLAGGVLIVLFKPFKIDDYIESNGVAGHVKLIQIFNTKVLTVENKMVIIPNASLTNNNIINYTNEEKRRVDISIGVSYKEDIKKVQKVLLKVAADNKKSLSSPEPAARVIGYGDNSVDFTFRVWCNTADYWDVFFDLNEAIKPAFDTAGIEIPYPQQDVHLYNMK